MKPLTTQFVFENRKYNESSTAEERAAILNTVTLYNDKIIYFKEIPVASTFNINLVFPKILKLAESKDACGLVIDLRETTKLPDADTRRTINAQFSNICDAIDHVAFVTGKNKVLNVGIKFIMHHTNLKSFSINTSVDQAMEKIKAILSE